MKKLLLGVLLMAGMMVCAQSNVSFDLRILSSTPLSILDTFPQPYATDKINIQLTGGNYDTSKVDSLNMSDYDFVVTKADDDTHEWDNAFDSIYSFTAEDAQFILWQNNKEIKNSQKRARTNRAYTAFSGYIRLQTQPESHLMAYIAWGCSGLLLLALLLYVGVVIKRKRTEKTMTSVQRETLRRKIEDRRRHLFSQSYLWLLLLILYAPIILILIYSFTESKVLGNWTGFSLQLYGNLFMGKGGEALNSAIINTLLIALIAAFSATILGTLAAIGIYNMRSKQRKVVSFLNSVPMINPDIITGISLFLLFVALGVSQGLATVCIAHIVFCTPYVVLSVLPRLSGMNPNTYEAALDLGATPFQALRMVLVPELWPGMLSGFILALTLSVDDFGVTFFTKGSGGLETLSTFIYSDARKGGLTPELRPLFSLILLVVLTVLIVINVRADKKAKQNNK